MFLYVGDLCTPQNWEARPILSILLDCSKMEAYLLTYWRHCLFPPDLLTTVCEDPVHLMLYLLENHS